MRNGLIGFTLFGGGSRLLNKISDFEICHAFHHLQVVDLSSTTFRSEHEFLLRATSPARFFERHYFWSGSGSTDEILPELVCEVDVWGHPKQRIHGPLIVENRKRIMLVDLGRTLNPGDETVVRIRHKMKDLGGTFNNRLGIVPSGNLPRLTKLSVDLPEQLANDVFFDTCVHESDQSVDVSKLQPTSVSDGRAIFQVPEFSPVASMAYRLRWLS